MTGEEFHAALKSAGLTQSEFADTVGVHRQTIGAQCKADAVALQYVYALAGVIAMRDAHTLQGIAAKI